MRAALLLTALLGAGCVSVAWERELRYEPVSRGAIARLESGRELQPCLAEFGAPLWVWELPDTGGGPGAALAYGWYDSSDVSVRVSIPVHEYYSGSLDYTRIDLRMKGLVLFFDRDWKLTAWKTGILRDLAGHEQRPPSLVDDDG